MRLRRVSRRMLVPSGLLGGQLARITADHLADQFCTRQVFGQGFRDEFAVAQHRNSIADGVHLMLCDGDVLLDATDLGRLELHLQ